MHYSFLLNLSLTAVAVGFYSVSCIAQDAWSTPKPDAAAIANQDEWLDPWRKNVKIQPVSGLTDRHVMHAYFNVCPESPDGKYVLYYTSSTTSGELGDLRIKERATGKETILVENIATEDAHRAACQQWSNNGKTVVYHEVVDGRWRVMAIDVDNRKPRVLAQDRQIGFGSPTGKLVPIYGCHWNPGSHRDLEVVDCVTGEIRTVAKVQDVVAENQEFVEKTFKSQDISIFFPIMSDDEKKVFFKLARPSGGDNFKTKSASMREGKVVYDVENKRQIRMMSRWGHPSWTPDADAIFEKGNYSQHLVTGNTKRYARSCFTDHPSVAPDGKLFVTDGDISRRPFGQPGFQGIAVGSMSKDDYVVIDAFNNTKGARSWRRSHPHPNFSADGRRIYYNVSDGPWTRLMVAEVSAEPALSEASAAKN